MKSRYKKETAREYPADVLRHRGIYCSSRERIKWCKKYLAWCGWQKSDVDAMVRKAKQIIEVDADAKT